MNVDARIRRDLKSLRSACTAIAARAEQRIGRAGSAAVPFLLPLAKSKDPVLRFRAAWALALTGDQLAVKTLTHLLNDPDERVAYDAGAGLSRIHSRQAAKAVYKYKLQNPTPRRDGTYLNEHSYHSKNFL